MGDGLLLSRCTTSRVAGTYDGIAPEYRRTRSAASSAAYSASSEGSTTLASMVEQPRRLGSRFQCLNAGLQIVQFADLDRGVQHHLGGSQAHGRRRQWVEQDGLQGSYRGVGDTASRPVA